MKRPIDLARLLARKAERDLLAAARLVQMGGPFDVACFHIQQAAEKYLKAYLDARTVDYPRTHDLDDLLDRCLAHDPDLESLRAQLRELEPYAVQVRYDDTYEPTLPEAERGLTIVRELRNRVIAATPDLGPGTVA